MLTDEYGSFWLKVDQSGDCWTWQGVTNTGGYGQYNLGAHRFSYFTQVGPLPPGRGHIDHRCRNILCVRPSHLEPVSQAENNRRQGAAQTHCRNGHLFDAVTTYIDPRGSRQCRICRNQHQKELYRRQHPHG